SITALGTEFDISLSNSGYTVGDRYDAFQISDNRNFSAKCGFDYIRYSTYSASHGYCPALPLDELGSLVTLTVTIRSLGSTDSHPETYLTGLWQVTATVPTAAPAAIVINTPAIVQHGISIQPIVAVVTKGSSQSGLQDGIAAQLHIDARASYYILCGV